MDEDERDDEVIMMIIMGWWEGDIDSRNTWVDRLSIKPSDLKQNKMAVIFVLFNLYSVRDIQIMKVKQR